MQHSDAADVLRLATLVVDTFELGARKAELDVGDELCGRFGIILTQLEDGYRSPSGGPLNDEQRRRLREEVARQLAERAQSAAALIDAVARVAAHFLTMVEEIYALLAQHDATADRPAERFQFRRQEGDLGLTLSRAFIERIRVLRSAVIRVEIGSVDEEKLKPFLGTDFDFYGTWPIGQFGAGDPPGARRVARSITYLSWLNDELKARGPRYAGTLLAIKEAFDAAGGCFGTRVVGTSTGLSS